MTTTQTEKTERFLDLIELHLNTICETLTIVADKVDVIFKEVTTPEQREELEARYRNCLTGSTEQT